MTVTIVRNAAVLDPVSATRVEGQAVAVENGRIADVGPRLTGPSDAVIVDAGNRTVMPGLIDAHTHPAIVDEDVFGLAEWPPSYVAARAGRVLRGMLLRGFTSIRDVGGGDHGLARAVDEGYFDGPRMFYGGKQLSQTGGAGDWRAPSRVVYDRHYYTPAIGVICDGVAEVRRAVREEVRRGAHHIKVYLSGAVDSPSDRVDSTQFSMEELVAIVEEATAANIYVAGHAYTSRAINRGLRAGVRSIEHGNLMDASSIPLFKEFGAFYVPTIVTYQTLAERARAGLLPADIEAKLTHVIDGALGALEMAHRAGLPIVYGTDLFAGTHDQQLREFVIRSEVQPPADLIRAATTTAARLLRREGELGVIAPGALADLLVIDGNPLDDIRVLTTPDVTLKLIMKDGQLVKNELPTSLHLADGFVQRLVDVLRVDVELVRESLLGPGDGLLDRRLDLGFADDEQPRLAGLDEVAELLGGRPGHSLGQVAGERADHPADGGRADNRRREDRADRRPDADPPPGAVPRRRLVLVLVHLAVGVLGHDGGVIGSDQATSVQVLDDLVVLPRRRLVRIGGDEDEYAVGLCHCGSLSGRSAVRSLTLVAGVDPVVTCSR
jgi:imidazolonepropionase-like amidohydrolase